MTDETSIDLFKWVPLFAVIVTATGWVITSQLASRNTSRHATNNELNRLIESLYKSLDDIYNEMLPLVTTEHDEHEKTVSYHKLINLVQNVRFICRSIVSLDHKQNSAENLIAELRQACTDDRKYSPSKIGITLPELRDVQERIKQNFNKKFD